MLKNPEVSIVMNCYNGEKYLCEAIESVLAQTFHNWELIFWDNKSEDGSAKIAKSFSDDRIHYYCAKKTTPLGEARNNAMKQSRGRYIAFLDCDDIYTPNSLNLRMRMMQEGYYGMVYGAAIRINGVGKRTGFYPARLNSGIIFSGLLARYEITMCTVLLRKEVLEKEGWNFQKDLHFLPDFNLFMKVAARYPTGVAKDPVLKCRKTKDNWTNKLRHVAGSEMERTLAELQNLYPESCQAAAHEFNMAKYKSCFYQALEKVLLSDYGSARRILQPAIRKSWYYRLIDITLCLRIPKEWLVYFLVKRAGG